MCWARQRPRDRVDSNLGHFLHQLDPGTYLPTPKRLESYSTEFVDSTEFVHLKPSQLESTFWAAQEGRRGEPSASAALELPPATVFPVDTELVPPCSGIRALCSVRTGC